MINALYSNTRLKVRADGSMSFYKGSTAYGTVKYPTWDRAIQQAFIFIKEMRPRDYDSVALNEAEKEALVEHAVYSDVEVNIGGVEYVAFAIDGEVWVMPKDRYRPVLRQQDIAECENGHICSECEEEYEDDQERLRKSPGVIEINQLTDKEWLVSSKIHAIVEGER